jgi:hypothetical protein
MYIALRKTNSNGSEIAEIITTTTPPWKEAMLT